MPDGDIRLHKRHLAACQLYSFIYLKNFSERLAIFQVYLAGNLRNICKQTLQVACKRGVTMRGMGYLLRYAIPTCRIFASPAFFACASLQVCRKVHLSAAASRKTQPRRPSLSPTTTRRFTSHRSASLRNATRRNGPSLERVAAFHFQSPPGKRFTMTERDIFLGVTIAGWCQIGFIAIAVVGALVWLACLAHASNYGGAIIAPSPLGLIIVAVWRWRRNKRALARSALELEAERLAETERRLRDRDDIIARQEIERSRIWERVNGV
jgi:hypothetical protein